MRHWILIFPLLMLVHSAVAFTSDTLTKSDQHTLVTMRMIGHQILLSVGDSTSLVRPVEKNGDQYKITFETEFEFLPDYVSMVIDSVIAATAISKNYVVEFVSCDPVFIVHSYEKGEEADVLACRGRPLPVDCYQLFITLLDAEGRLEEPMVVVDERESGAGVFGMSWFFIFILVLLLLIGLIIFLISQKSGKNADPHVIKIGDFLFNKRNMELSIHDSKIELTSKEADLLQMLSESANDTVERDDILKEVWGDEGDYVGRTLDVFISKLRKKLEADSNVKIINIRGIGYRLVLNGQDV